MLRQLFDSRDASVALSHVLGALGTLAYLGLHAWTVIAQGHPMDGISFGAGLAAVLGGTGAAGKMMDGQKPAEAEQ